MAIKYFDDINGDDNNTGNLPSQAYRTITKFNATVWAAGDIALFRRGGVWYGQANINDNGSSGNRITLDDWGDGSEKNNKPIFSNPDAITSNPICLEILGDYISVYDIEFRDAKQAGIYIYQTNDNNIVERCHFTNVGRGVYCKGNYNIIRYCTGHSLRMARNVGDSSDAGALFVVFQKNSGGDTCIGNQMLYNFVILAKAPSVTFTNDGSLLEIFGGVVDFICAYNIVVGAKGMIEVGGDTARAETTSGGRVHHNLVINCYGIIVYFNDPADNFFVDVSDLQILWNTFIMADYSRSGIYFAGNWTGTGKVVYKNNVWRGRTTFAATNGTTNLNTVMDHTYNKYDRYDGSTSLGITLGTGESNGTIGFVDEAAGDYRIASNAAVRGAGVAVAGYTTDIQGNTMASPPSMGAFEYKAATRNIGASVRKPLKLPTDQSNAYVVHCNDVKGGRHIYASPLQMWAIPSAKKLQGMDCYLTDYQQTWRLNDPLLYTWTLVPEYDPQIKTYTALIQDVKAQNTDSGQGTAAQWNTRTLTEITYDDGLDIGLNTGTNVITLRRAGTYEFEFWVMNEKTNAFAARLYNVSAGAVVPKGQSPFVWAGQSSSTNSITRHKVQVTITGSTDFRLENYYALVNNTTATQSYGRPANVSGQSEIYAGVYIRRLH